LNVIALKVQLDHVQNSSLDVLCPGRIVYKFGNLINFLKKIKINLGDFIENLIKLFIERLINFL
jgi:hypothetical protein